ncbi:MAG: c-type cytochrome [Rhodocyclaceae bacterium]|nr:c-type cytochrome [Rhodocyclaceae bacterium]
MGMVKDCCMALGLLLACGGVFADDAAVWIGIKDAAWNEMYPERIEAMRAKGDAVRGESEFVICQGCHRPGAVGRADGSYPRLAGQHVSVLIKQMTDVQTERRSNPKMAPFIHLHEILPQHVADIAVYLHALPVPANQGQGPGDKLERGRLLYEKDCASCHGNRGEGSDEKFYPRVSGQHFKYLLRESQTIRDGKRRNANPVMVKVIKSYTDEDIAAVADFMSRLPVRP